LIMFGGPLRLTGINHIRVSLFCREIFTYRSSNPDSVLAVLVVAWLFYPLLSRLYESSEQLLLSVVI
jgi:hypothetical protein